MKNLFHGNLKVCQLTRLLLLLLIVFFPSIKWYKNFNFCLIFKGSYLKETLENVINCFIVYKLDGKSQDLNSDRSLKGLRIWSYYIN